VLLTEDASSDPDELYNVIATHDTPSKAEYVLDRTRKVMEILSSFPERGSYLALGVREYRQTFFKPYRVICRVIDDRVDVYLIVDGRRDMQALLQRRLLGS